MFPAQQVAAQSGASNPNVATAEPRNLCNYLTDLQLFSSAGTGAIITILDGANVIFTIVLPPNTMQQPAPVRFTTPLKGSPNTAMSIQSSTASATYRWNAQGFVAAAAL